MSQEGPIEQAWQLADRLAATNAIGKEQAKVYVFRDVFGFGRSETADLLDKSPNTVDNLRSSAARRVFEARRLIDVFEREPDLIEVRRSRRKKWHRDPHDPEACQWSGGVMPRETYEYRAIPETDIESLSGDLCGTCFPNAD